MSRVSRRLRAAHAANARIHVRNHSLLLQLEAVRQGLGYAFLPCILAESDPGLLGLAIFHRCSVHLCGC